MASFKIKQSGSKLVPIQISETILKEVFKKDKHEIFKSDCGMSDV